MKLSISSSRGLVLLTGLLSSEDLSSQLVFMGGLSGELLLDGGIPSDQIPTPHDFSLDKKILLSH